MVEYGLILALVAVACIGAVTTFGETLSNWVVWRIFQSF
ncbi:MAG: Flp family type IVb pilin [Dehalococcoidia bacterium]